MGSQHSNLDDILAEDMHHWYNKFMRESPSGLITLFELKAILDLKGINENANSYVEQVFFTFDMDGVRPTHTNTPALVSLDQNPSQSMSHSECLERTRIF